LIKTVLEALTCPIGEGSYFRNESPGRFPAGAVAWTATSD
jgi:hypothetical protein